MASWAKPGVKVVCIEGGVWNKGHDPKFGHPIKGQIYTLASTVFISRFWGEKTVRLSELPNPWARDPSEDAGWALSRFKPFITKTQSEDTEMFLRIASKAPSNMEMVE